jgi:hypothetical protein
VAFWEHIRLIQQKCRQLQADPLRWAVELQEAPSILNFPHVQGRSLNFLIVLLLYLAYPKRGIEKLKIKKRWFLATLLVVLIGGCDGGTATPSVDIEVTVGAVEQSNESNDDPPLMSTVQVIPSNQVAENNDNYNTNPPEYMRDVWLCTSSDMKTVDDLTTSDVEDYRCFVTVEYTEQFAIVRSNGIPNHDYESGLGCCAAEVDYEWRIPLKPELASSVTYAPERGAVAISVNGVPFFGPEEGPGGDAVALHFEYFVEEIDSL